MTGPTVAIDVGSLHGPQTGVGQFVGRLLAGLSALDDPPAMQPYVLSFRAELSPGVRRLRWPAMAALQAWGRSDHPTADRALAGSDVVHGPNYIVPPSRLPTVVSVHDCWFLQRPEQVGGAVQHFGAVLRRAVRRGVTVHVPSQHTAEQVRELLGAERVAVVPLGSPTLLPPGLPSTWPVWTGGRTSSPWGPKSPGRTCPASSTPSGSCTAGSPTSRWSSSVRRDLTSTTSTPPSPASPVRRPTRS